MHPSIPHIETKETHSWTVEKGISPKTDIYKMVNGLRVVHMKDLNRAFVQSLDPNLYFSPINTEGMTIIEWEQTLLGIEKLLKLGLMAELVDANKVKYKPLKNKTPVRVVIEAGEFR